MLLEAGNSFLFNLDPQLLFDTILLAAAVLALCFLMSSILFNPARKFLKDRQDRIANDISTAKQDKENAELLQQEYEEKLKNID